MALETTFRVLRSSLHKLHDALNALRMTVGDRPPNDEAAVADGLENALLDMLGKLQDAHAAGREAYNAVGGPVDLDRARRALTKCQESFHAIEQQFATDLVSYEKVKQLERIGRARRHEWIPWANSAKQGIDQCREPIKQISMAIASCWQELAERLGMISVSVQNTNVGQRLITKHTDGVEIEDVVHKGT